MAVSRRTDTPTAKREAVEAAVLRATGELLAGGSSYADLNVERIAGRAGISRTAFYFYFRDKRELLLRATEDVSALLYAEGEAWWSGEGDGASELRRALATIGELYREHGALLRAVVEVATYDSDVAEFWRALVDRFVVATRARIEAEQVAGRAPALPAAATAFALTWMTERSFYQLARPGPAGEARVETDELVEALAEIWLRTVYGA